MRRKSKTISPEFQNVKLPTSIVERLRKHKKETFVPIIKTAEIAIAEYLDKYDKSQNSDLNIINQSS